MSVRNLQTSLLLTLLLAIAGCGMTPEGDGKSDIPGTPEAKDPDAMRPELPDVEVPVATEGANAPRPFSAEQIREAMPVGQVQKRRIEQLGAPPVTRIQTVQAADAESVTLAFQNVPAGADPASIPPTPVVLTWEELSAHGTFPRESTTIESTRLELECGRVRCLVYTVTQGKKVQHLYFSPELPGAPVKVVSENRGVQDLSMELLEVTPRPADIRPRQPQ